MGFYRLLVAHCDGKDFGGACPTSERLSPDTTQPYRDLVEKGWTIADDGVTMYCPKSHRKEP